MIYLTFLRHGRSTADDEDVFESRYDSELSIVGRNQAAEIAGKRKSDDSRRYDVIVTSPLKRARSTADIIGRSLEVPVVESELLQIDAGEHVVTVAEASWTGYSVIVRRRNSTARYGREDGSH